MLIGELIISESKTQVYGYLYNFFALHHNIEKFYWYVTNDHYLINFCLCYLIEFICYDDAWHLKRFGESKKE